MATIIRLPQQPASILERYRLLVDTVDEYAIFMIDPAGMVLTWNRGAQRLEGYAPEEILGKHFSTFYPPEDIAAGKPSAQLELARANGKVIDEGFRVRKDGTRFWADVTLTTLRDDAGEVVGYAEVARDLTEPREREEAVRRSEERLRLLVESVSDYALYMLDRGGLVTTWNLGAQRLKGYAAHEILGKHFSLFFPPEAVRDGRPQHELEVAAREGRFEDEGWRIRKDGSRFWANVVVTAIHDATGELVGFAKVTRDLSARRAADEQVRRSEERLRLLVEAVSDYAVYMLDPAGFVTTWNQGAQQLKGYTPSEILGEHFSRFFPPEAVRAGKPEAELAAAREHGRFEEEGWRLRKDGTRFWASVVLTSIRGPHDELLGFAKVTRDLSDRRRAEEELRRSEERLRLLVEAVSDYAVYMLDPGGYVTTWNVGAQRIKGYAPDEIIGKHFSLFFTPEAVRAGKPELELERARADGRFEDEDLRVRKDGSRFLANVIITPIRGPHDELLGYAKVTRDLTDRVKAEHAARSLAAEKAARAAAEANEASLREAAEKAELAARRAEEANRAKDQFLSTVSHELRTPLNAIMGWASAVQGRSFDPTVAKAIEVIQRNAASQAKIIDDILDVSRIVTGKLRLDLKPVELVAMLRAELDVVRPAAEAKGIVLTLSSGAEVCALVGDPTRIQQVIWNLLSNAVKFTGEGGRVDVSLHEQDARAVLTVSDNGRGIEPAFVPYVFERFQQADASTTRRVGGLGLGLAIVKDLVNLHGGDVRVESEGPGQGATFTVSLPIRALGADQDGNDAGHESLRPPQLPLRDTRTLVVDDEPDARELLKDLLTQEGSDTRMAASASEAFELVQQFRPHVLISDIGMPVQDGYSLMRRIRALGAQGAMPAIALTAYTQAKDRAAALDAGFTLHMSKPVDPEALVAAVARLAKSSK